MTLAAPSFTAVNKFSFEIRNRGALRLRPLFSVELSSKPLVRISPNLQHFGPVGTKMNR